MNKKILLIGGLIFLILIVIIYFSSRKEFFVQGYDYTIADCIRRCEFDVNNKNHFYSLYEDDGYASNAFCTDFCRTSYNKDQVENAEQLLKEYKCNKRVCNCLNCGGNEPISGCQMRKVPYWIAPLKSDNYFASNCNHSLFLK